MLTGGLLVEDVVGVDKGPVLHHLRRRPVRLIRTAAARSASAGVGGQRGAAERERGDDGVGVPLLEPDVEDHGDVGVGVVHHEQRVHHRYRKLLAGGKEVDCTEPADGFFAQLINDELLSRRANVDAAQLVVQATDKEGGTV